MTSLIKVPFASSGDKTAVPDTDAGGSVNMTQGYGQAYSLDPATDPSAKRIEREKMNWLFNLITSALKEIQAGGITPFITSTDNGGAPYSYGKGATIILGGVVYQSLEDSNTTTPPGAKWSEVKNSSNGLTRQNPFGDIKADGSTAVATALSNLGLGSAAKKDIGTGVGQIPDMSSYTFTGDANKFVIQFPGGFCIQGGKASTDANGFSTVNLGLAMSTYSVVVGEGFVSNWVESGNVYSGLVIYGSQILDASSFGFRSIWWQGASKTFQGAQATAQWMAYGKI